MEEVKNNNNENSQPKVISENGAERVLDLTINSGLLNSTISNVEETTKNEEKTEAVVEETTEKKEKPEVVVEVTTEKEEKPEAVVEETSEKEEKPEAVVEVTTEKEEKPEAVVEVTTDKAEAEIKLKIEKINNITENKIKDVEKVEENTTSKVKEVVNSINVKSFKNNNITKNLEVSDKIYHLVKDNIRGFDFDNTNVIILVTKVMSITGKVSTLTGMEKKSLVLSICERILDEDTSIDKDDQKFIHLTLHSLVDLMVDVSKGKLKLNNKLSKKKKENVPKLPPGQIIESVIDKLKTIIKNRKYSCQEIIVNLSIITGMVMTIIEQYPYLSGVEKKNIVIQVLKRLIKQELPKIVNVSDENQVMINLALETLPNVIDTLIGVSSGKVKVNEQTVATGCLSLFSCLKNRNAKKKENVKTPPQAPVVEVVDDTKTTESPETTESPDTTETPDTNETPETTERPETNKDAKGKNIPEVQNVDEVELVVDGTLTEKKKAFLDKTDGLVVDRLNEAINNNPYSENNTKTLKEDDTQNDNPSKLSVV